MSLTMRQRDALQVLQQSDRPLTPAAFAAGFWPGKQFARGNGPWGIGPDASGRHGGRMLTRLHRMGLVALDHYPGGYTATITPAGRTALEECYT